jgi:exodeoxyribonuclease III
MAFRKKADFILKLKPDILIVPECEHPDKLKFNLDTPKYTDVLWFGSNQNKGLAILSYSNFKFKLIDTHNPDLRMIIPIAVSDGNIQFTLFAIWAYNPMDADYKYVGQIWKAISYYESLMKEENIILAGDFNSNTIWDKLHRKISHTMLVEKLTSLNIFSTYHSFTKLPQGIEEHPTYFMYRHQNKPYHIDYCFASSTLLEKLVSVEIGDYNDWIKYSDHVPVIATFKDTLLNRANA